MTFVDEGNGLCARNTSDGYWTFLISWNIPENRISKLKFKILNSYGWNLHVGVVTKYDFDQACKITDYDWGYGLFVKEHWARNNNQDGLHFGDLNWGNGTEIEIVMNWKDGSIYFWGKLDG